MTFLLLALLYAAVITAAGWLTTEVIWRWIERFRTHRVLKARFRGLR